MNKMRRILAITKYEILGRRNTFIFVTLISIFNIVLTISGEFLSSLIIYFIIIFLTVYVAFYPNEQYQVNKVSLKEVCISRGIQVSFFLFIWIILNLVTKYTVGISKQSVDLAVIITYSYTFNLIFTVISYRSAGYDYQNDRSAREDLNNIDDVKRRSLKWNSFYQISFFISLLVIPFFFDTLIGPRVYKYAVLIIIIIIFIINIIYIEKVYPEVDR